MTVWLLPINIVKLIRILGPRIMFNIQEIKFLSAELARFMSKMEQHLHDMSLEE